MRLYIFGIIIFILGFAGLAHAASLAERLAGRILLQVESRGEAWYVDPTDLNRTHLIDGTKAYRILRNEGLGIKNSDLQKIPLGIVPEFISSSPTITEYIYNDNADFIDPDRDKIYSKVEKGIGTDPLKKDSDDDGYDDLTEIKNGFNPLGAGQQAKDEKLINRLKGRILLQVESRGEAWYVNPTDGKRYYMPDGESAYATMRALGLGIKNHDLEKIPIREISKEIHEEWNTLNSFAQALSQEDLQKIQSTAVGFDDCLKIQNQRNCLELYKYNYQEIEKYKEKDFHIVSRDDAHTILATSDNITEQDGTIALSRRYIQFIRNPKDTLFVLKISILSIAGQVTENITRDQLLAKLQLRMQDSDSDGITDIVEKCETFQENCKKTNFEAKDTDGDRWIDSIEISMNKDPNLSELYPYDFGSVIQIDPITDFDHLRGEKDAPISFIVFSATECVFCQWYHNNLNEILNEYQGKIKVAYRHFMVASLHKNALKEAEALECAAELGGNQGFWNYLDALFANPIGVSEPRQKLLEMATAMNLDQMKFEDCLNSEKYVEKIKGDYYKAIAAGAQGIPHTVVVTKSGQKIVLRAAIFTQQLRDLIDKLLDE